MARMFRASLAGLAVLVAVLAAACGRHPPDAGAPPGATAQADPALPAGRFGLARLEVETYEGRPSALLTFSRPLASAQTFDTLGAVSSEAGAPVAGSWVLGDEPTRLRFPYLDADKTYRIALKPDLAAADGTTLGEAVSRELYTGPLEPIAGFASQGSVLPTHESRGLPVVTVNVPELDLEFLRVRLRDLPKFLADYTRNGRRSYWSLSELSNYAEPVYANRFAIEAAANQRTLSYIPVRDLPELREPGLYFAVMKRPGRFTHEYDTAMFVVSDLGVHVRAYRDRLVVHAASLESGKPAGGVRVYLRRSDDTVHHERETDAQGIAVLEGYTLDARDVLIAERARDFSVLALNQPALDLSEFAIAGRAQRELEIFPWSGRDLYRPGERLRIAALLRDHDGRPVAPQPLYASLKQPDGRVVATATLQPGALGDYEYERRIAADARTGRWSLELSTDPAGKAGGSRAFEFRVEEFLPERLKLELSSSVERLAPGEDLPLEVEADYLYGAPAAGNRFTARVTVVNDAHPVDALADFHFGDPLTELPKAPRDAIDEVLDEDGRLATRIAPVEGLAISAPTRVVVSGSVYETGGRAVTRTLDRTIWPADTIVGIRPLFALDDGSTPNSSARFEIVRTNAAGELLPAAGLKVRAVREHRDFTWRHDATAGWRADYVQRWETTHDAELSFAAGARGQVAFPVEWGNYRLEVEDPETGLVAKLPFVAGWGWDDDNRGTDARPDKVKLALGRTHHRGGDTLQVTLTPPHAGPALLLLEGDTLLWHDTREVEAGSVVEIPIDPSWERHDLYFTAIVFRPGSAPRKVTPNRAVGIVHVPIAREERRIAATIATPETMRPKAPLAVEVEAPALAGQTAHVRVTAVDLGVLNLTRYPVPDAAAWFFAQRRLGVDAYDLYARVIEAFDGEKARLRYGGDAALAALPSARRPDPGIETVDLFHAAVRLDASGKARVSIDVPDFNGTLRVRALVYGASTYGAAERDTIVRAPLVVEASTPRVLAPGDRAKLTLDLQNLSGAERAVETTLTATGPIALQRTRERSTIADGARSTLSIGLTATGTYGVGEIRARVVGEGIDVDRTFRVVVRPAWPETARASAAVLETAAPVVPDPALRAGLVPESVVARVTVGTLPPFPFGAAVRGLVGYPYGCIEQTTSRAYPLVGLDDATAQRFGLEPVPAAKRSAMLADAFSRISAMQNENGHFGMWPGDGWVATQLTPYVAELLLDARDAGHAIPEPVLAKALERINEDLLAGGNGHYEYDHAEHLRLAEMAHGAFVLARVRKAPVGTLRALHDNERAKLEGPLPLVHLGIALKLMGDAPRAEAAIEEAFTRKFERPDYLGDYGTTLRDLALMVALTHEHGVSKPAYDARVVELARTLLGRGAADTRWYLSTQEQVAIFRLGRALVATPDRTFAASIVAGDSVEERAGESLVARTFTPIELAAGARIVPSGTGPFWVTQDAAGISRTPPEASTEAAPLRIRRSWHRTDGTAFEGETLHEGEILVAHLVVESNETMNDALVVDLLPGGLELENLALTDASQWEGVTIDGVALNERANAAELRYEEYRDDRYVAAIRIWGGSAAHLFYLVRAVSPGEFTMPPPAVEDMYRPMLRAFGAARPARLTVAPPKPRVADDAAAP